MNGTTEQEAGKDIPVILCLVLAGEMIFALPFHITRFFRPTFLEVFGFSNAELGDVFALYGVLAMLCYFPGGILADHFPARRLLTVSLVATAAGGVYMATIPIQSHMSMLYAYWGMTSILLFWSALIRATREWGGQWAQGRAFGLLDGGRGLVAAAAAVMAVFLFDILLPEDVDTLTSQARTHALQWVIIMYSVMTLLIAGLIWTVIPDRSLSNNRERYHAADVLTVIRSRRIWLQALVVVCAYCGYKGIDNYGLYAVQVLNMSEVDAARLVSNSAWLRPVAAIGAGFMADRFSASRIVSIGFLLLLFTCLGQSMIHPQQVLSVFILANLVLTMIAVYAVRGVYFALLEETQVTKRLTGTAVGLISVIGFTPDVFFAAFTGRLLDAAPGLAGYRHYFLFLALVSAIGLVATGLLARFRPKPAQ